MRSQTWWYVARAGGIIAWALASLAVIGGLQLSTRLVRKPAPSWVLDVHRFLGGLTVAFVAVHMVGLAADQFIGFGPVELLVPFASSYKPAAVALGVVGMYLLIAIELTSLAMRKMPRRTWHAVHLTSFVLFVVATVHGITAGTDRHNARVPVGLPAHGGRRPHDDARPDLVAATGRTGGREPGRPVALRRAGVCVARSSGVTGGACSDRSPRWAHSPARAARIRASARPPP